MSEQSERDVHATAGHLKAARDALSDAKQSRDPEAINEAQAEFDRCDELHRAAVRRHRGEGTQGALL